MGKSVDIENKKMRKDVNVLPHRTAQPIGTLAYWHIDTLFIILKLPAHPSPRVLP